MATALYDTGRNAFLNAGVNYLTDTISAMLIHNSAGGTSYVVNLATDQFYSIVPTAAIVAGAIGTPVNLGTKTSSAGIANCANIVFTSVSGVQVDAIVLYKNTGTGTTSQLIAYIDNATGLPVVPNGSNITLNIDSGVNKLFKL